MNPLRPLPSDLGDFLATTAFQAPDEAAFQSKMQQLTERCGRMLRCACTAGENLNL
jgi:hypothetical protein